MKHFFRSLALLAITIGGTAAFGQGQLLSPPAETSATIGGHSVTIKYGAPSVRERKIFGDLVPFL